MADEVGSNRRHGADCCSVESTESHHAWAVEQFDLAPPPMLTCEAVLSEARFLLRGIDGGVNALMQLISRGVLAIPFRLSEELNSVSRLLSRYRSVPMSLADACIVKIADRYGDATVLTLDRHFQIYRKSGRLVIPTLMP